MKEYEELNGSYIADSVNLPGDEEEREEESENSEKKEEEGKENKQEEADKEPKDKNNQNDPKDPCNECNQQQDINEEALDEQIGDIEDIRAKIKEEFP
jgi:hypothetical protein